MSAAICGACGQPGADDVAMLPGRAVPKHSSPLSCVNALRAENERLRAEVDKAHVKRIQEVAKIEIRTQRELERWRHGNTVEGDFICPDSLALTNLRSAAQEVVHEYESHGGEGTHQTCMEQCCLPEALAALRGAMGEERG